MIERLVKSKLTGYDAREVGDKVNEIVDHLNELEIEKHSGVIIARPVYRPKENDQGSDVQRLDQTTDASLTPFKHPTTTDSAPGDGLVVADDPSSYTIKL